MEIKSSEIKHFKQLYRSKFGIELDDKTARYKLLKLVRQMSVVYQQITPKQLSDYETQYEHMNNNKDKNYEQIKTQVSE